MKKIASIALLVLIVFSALLVHQTNVVTHASPTIQPVHNINTGLNYTTIQAAIDAPETLDGHTLMCDAGNYTGTVNVYKWLTIIGAINDSKINPPTMCDTLVVNTKPGGKAGANVRISGFKIISHSGFSGVLLNHTSGCIISNDTFTGTGGGITLRGSNDNVISGNRLYSLPGDGICVTDSSQRNKIIGNNLNRNHYGIVLFNASNYNVISDDSVNSSAWSGIRLNWQGSGYAPVAFNNVTNNVVTRNGGEGIFSDQDACEGLVSYNFLSNNYIGIRLRQSNSSIVVHNTVISNSYRGISAESSYGNTVYDNFLNNTNNAWDNGANSWNTTKQTGPNIIGGPYIGGNYWSDNPNPVDTNHDGLGDVPYNITGAANKDFLPVVGPIPIPIFFVTILAYDYSLGQGVSVLITGTYTFNTPRYSLVCFGPTTFLAPFTDGIDSDTFLWWGTSSGQWWWGQSKTVSSSGTYTAFYGTPSIPPRPYNVTIRAYDIPNYNYVSVSIEGTGFSTDGFSGHTFLCSGPCTFRVPWWDLPTYYNLFSHWEPTLITTRWITVTGSGTYTAYYGNETWPYNVTIRAYDTTHPGYVSVSILGTGFSTDGSSGHTFLCSGLRVFSVPSSDGYGDQFFGWSNGWPNTMLPVIYPGIYTAYYSLQPVPVHDVNILYCYPSKTVVGQGFSNNINVTVYDGVPAEPINMTFYANQTIIGTLTNLNLPCGNSTTITFKWNTTGFAYGHYSITAYAVPVPGETDTTDNTYIYGTIKITIPGDIDGNGKVTWEDLSDLGLAYGSMPGDRYWNPNADIDSSGKVTWEDLSTLGLNYGKSW
jgi:parallel beta-helix repeat protein